MIYYMIILQNSRVKSVKGKEVFKDSEEFLNILKKLPEQTQKTQ